MKEVGYGKIYPMGPSYSYEEEQAGWETSSTEQPLDSRQMESSSLGMAIKIDKILSSLVLLLVCPLMRFIKNSKRRKTILLCIFLLLLTISVKRATAIKVEEVIKEEQTVEIRGRCEMESVRDMF